MPHLLTVSNQIRQQVRALEVRLIAAEQKAARKQKAGTLLLAYLELLGAGKSPSPGHMRRIRGAAAEFINP